MRVLYEVPTFCKGTWYKKVKEFHRELCIEFWNGSMWDLYEGGNWSVQEAIEFYGELLEP